MAATNNKLLKKFQDEKIKISNNLQKLKILKFDRVDKNQLFQYLQMKFIQRKNDF